MVKSKFIYDILDLLIDGDDSRYLASQLNCIEVDNIDYTGTGVFVHFRHLPQVINYLFKEPGVYLDGVTVESPELEGKASASLHFVDGIIDNLEIWSTSGSYPAKELSNYTIRQDLSVGRGRSITV